MHVDQFGRAWSGPHAFTRETIGTHAPAAAGVYQVVYDGQIAYVGIATRSNTIRKRLTAHLADRSNWALGRLTEPEKFSFVFFECDEATAHQIESYICTHQKPPFNVRSELKHLIPSIAVH